MISVTITDRSGRTLSGQTIDAFWVSIAHARPFSVGINCALGARDMRPYLAELARIADCYVSCYPNAGLPNAFGQYDEQPAETGGYLREFATSGFVNIVGGCCGTTPDHIAAIARRRRSGLPPRRAIPANLGISAMSAFVHAVRGARDADHPARLQLPDDRRADQRHRLAAVRAADQGGRLRRRRREVALEQVRGGANLIDVNMDEGMLDSEQAMTALPQLHRHRARNRARAVHDRQLEVVGDPGRPEVRAGQAGRQLDQPEGRRSRLPGARPRSSSATAPASS